MATKDLQTLDIRVGTAEQLATLEVNPDALEFETDGQYPASSVSFDNTGTTLSATDVQAAIVEAAQSGGGSGGTILKSFSIDPDAASVQSTYELCRIPLTTAITQVTVGLPTGSLALLSSLAPTLAHCVIECSDNAVKNIQWIYTNSLSDLIKYLNFYYAIEGDEVVLVATFTPSGNKTKGYNGYIAYDPQTTNIANLGTVYAGTTSRSNLTEIKVATTQELTAHYVSNQPLALLSYEQNFTNDLATPFAGATVNLPTTSEYVGYWWGGGSYLSGRPIGAVAISDVGDMYVFGKTSTTALNVTPATTDWHKVLFEPGDGTAGQVLTKTDTGVEWAEPGVPLPALPDDEGSYVLKCTVSNGAKTLQWVAE